MRCHGGLRDGRSDCLAEKGFSVARTELAPGAILDVYNVHGEAGDGPGDVEARAAGYLQLAEFMREHSAGHAVLLGGDTNLNRRRLHDEIVLGEFLSSTGLQDACEFLACGDDRIDRFLFRSGPELELVPLLWALAEEFVDPGGHRLSDHPAVRMTFAWSLRAR